MSEDNPLTEQDFKRGVLLPVTFPRQCIYLKEKAAYYSKVQSAKRLLKQKQDKIAEKIIIDMNPNKAAKILGRKLVMLIDEIDACFQIPDGDDEHGKE
jgi:hypothetical protein